MRLEKYSLGEKDEGAGLAQPRKEKGKERTLISFQCLKSFCEENSYSFLKFTEDLTGKN